MDKQREKEYVKEQLELQLRERSKILFEACYLGFENVKTINQIKKLAKKYLDKWDSKEKQWIRNKEFVKVLDFIRNNKQFPISKEMPNIAYALMGSGGAFTMQDYLSYYWNYLKRFGLSCYLKFEEPSPGLKYSSIYVENPEGCTRLRITEEIEYFRK